MFPAQGAAAHEAPCRTCRFAPEQVARRRTAQKGKNMAASFWLRSLRGRSAVPAAALIGAALALAGCSGKQAAPAPQQEVAGCAGDNGGLTLAPGFCATVFADDVGHARHLAVGADGTVYANSWSGQYYPNMPPPAGGFLVAMKDTNGDGKADQ